MVHDIAGVVARPQRVRTIPIEGDSVNDTSGEKDKGDGGKNGEVHFDLVVSELSFRKNISAETS